MPAEAWTRIRRAIVNVGHEVVCRLMIDWLSVALTKKVGDNKSPLSMPQPTAPLAKGDCLCHHHHMFTQHIPRLDLAL